MRFCCAAVYLGEIETAAPSCARGGASARHSFLQIKLDFSHGAIKTFVYFKSAKGRFKM